jgi:hypothetical protein
MINNLNTKILVYELSRKITSELQNFMFEINDSLTRTMIKNSVNTLLQSAKNKRALYDYKVVCDETNNPPHLIDHHGLKVDVLIQPTASIQHVLIPISIYDDDYIFHPPIEIDSI